MTFYYGFEYQYSTDTISLIQNIPERSWTRNFYMQQVEILKSPNTTWKVTCLGDIYRKVPAVLLMFTGNMNEINNFFFGRSVIPLIGEKYSYRYHFFKEKQIPTNVQEWSFERAVLNLNQIIWYLHFFRTSILLGMIFW